MFCLRGRYDHKGPLPPRPYALNPASCLTESVSELTDCCLQPGKCIKRRSPRPSEAVGEETAPLIHISGFFDEICKLCRPVIAPQTLCSLDQHALFASASRPKQLIDFHDDLFGNGDKLRPAFEIFGKSRPS